MNLYIDIGGTHTRFQLDNNKIVYTKDRDIISLLDRLIAQYPIQGVYISFAGEVRDNIIYSAPNIKIDKLDLNALYPNIKFRVENDVNCAVLAQSDYYSCGDIVALYIGTGIGAGVISNNQLIKGSRGVATEIGHIPFKKAPFVCGCGKDNCIELFCSGGAIKKWAEYLNGDFQKLDELPKDLYHNFLEAFLYSASILVTLFNPKILVLGGGVVESNSFLVEYLQKNISKYAFGASLDGLEIVQTKIDHAPLEGCKILI